MESQTVPEPSRPWDRQTGEGDAPWKAFREFMKRRSLVDVANRLGNNERTIRNYSSKWNWAERVAAWDEAIAQSEDAAVLDERGRLAKEHLEHWRAIRHLAMSEISKMVNSIGTKSGLDERKLRYLASTVDLATKNERLVIGEATERSDMVDSREHIDLSGLSTEEVLKFRELLRKANGE